MELLYVFRILNRKKWIIAGAGLLGLLVAFLLTMGHKKLYKSQSQMSTGFTVSEQIKLSEDIFNMSQIDVKFNNVIENITSPKVINLLSYKLILRDLSSQTPFTKVDLKDVKDDSELKSLNMEQAKKIIGNKYDSLLLLASNVKEEKAVLELIKAYKYDMESVKKRLYVTRYQRTDYVNIFFSSENPELSAFVVNNLIKEFQRYYDHTKRERSIESMVALDSMVKKRKTELDDKISAKSKFLQDSVVSTLDPNLVGANKLSQMSMNEAGLADQLSLVSNLTYQLEQINLQLQGLKTDVATPATPVNDNQQYFALRKQYNDLYDEYIKNGASDPAVKQRLEDLQTKMKSVAPTGTTTTTPNNNYAASQQSILTQNKIDIEGKLRAAQSKISFYRSKLGEANSFISSATPKATSKLEQFDKEIEVATLEYTSAKEKQTLAANMSDSGVANFMQTIYGQPALNPEPSKRLMVMALCFFGGLVLASVLFIFLAYLDQSIQTPSQFQRQTDLKLIGSINHINLKATNLKEQITQIESDEANRKNSFRELLRKLRYEIESTGKRIILLTSTEPQQGKTTLTQALAFSLSLSKKRVLIIDTNFCNNDLTAYNDAQPTLEQFSVTDEKLDFASVEKIITPTGVEDVDIIGCKGGDYTPSEILPKNHLLKFLPQFLKKYDFIFMEGAPLNGYTDTKELVQYADGVLAIFAATSELKQADKESIKFFGTIKDKFLGAVLNKVDDENLNN